MCYAGGPYCYRDSYVSYTKARGEFDEVRKEYMDLTDAKREHELDYTGTVPDPGIDENTYQEVKNRHSKASYSLWKAQAKIRSTRESVEEAQLTTLTHGSPDSPEGGRKKDPYKVRSEERTRILSSSALREHVSTQLNVSRTSVKANKITLVSTSKDDTMTYSNEDGEPIYRETFTAGETFTPTAGENPSVKRVAYADDYTYRKHQVGHVVDDGLGNVYFHPDGDTASVELIKEGQPSKRGWHSIRESNVPSPKNPQVSKHHQNAYEKKTMKDSMRAEAYETMNKDNPDADKKTKELRARLYDSMADVVKYKNAIEGAKDPEKAKLLLEGKKNYTAKVLAAYKTTHEWKRGPEAEKVHTNLSIEMLGKMKNL